MLSPLSRASSGLRRQLSNHWLLATPFRQDPDNYDELGHTDFAEPLEAFIGRLCCT